MANMITEDCIACGACEDECPNGAISLRDEIFVIDPTLCSECVGLHERPKCAEACPIDCCVPDPSRRESQDVLLARTRELHPDRANALEPDDGTSHFGATSSGDLQRVRCLRPSR